MCDKQSFIVFSGAFLTAIIYDEKIKGSEIDIENMEPNYNFDRSIIWNLNKSEEKLQRKKTRNKITKRIQPILKVL